jgi:hypothetical protein
MIKHCGKFVSYLRVSTKRQGESGLGLEAQRAAVATWLNGGSWQLVEEHVEVESGKRDDNRPALAKAFEACNAKLVIAKLDRLSRDAHFLLGFRKPVSSSLRSTCPSQPAHRRHHGAGCRTGARGDQPAHQGGPGCRKGPRREARQS